MQTDLLDIRNCDNMELMAEFDDNHFDLAIVDPPYGAGNNYNFRHDDKHKYDNTAGPPTEYYTELFRVSRNQIVWGGNYFTDHLPVSRGWLCWDKVQTESGRFSHFELAWTSFDKVARFVRCANAGFNHGDLRNGEKETIHPTQKPKRLYDWLLDNIASDGDRILDTHLGSGSIAISCHYKGYHLTACEIDPVYYKKTCKRIKEQIRQTTIFDD